MVPVAGGARPVALSSGRVPFQGGDLVGLGLPRRELCALPLVHIDDPGDPRLDDYRALTDAALRKRYEGQAGVFIAEGPNVVRALVDSRYPVRSLLLTPERVPANRDLVERVDAPSYVLERDELYRLVRFRLHQGVLGCGQRLALPPPAAVVDNAEVAVVLEETNDPENLGALFRNARGLGVGAVLLGPRCADPLYRRAVRVSMGHVLHQPWTQVEDLAVTLHDLRERGFVLAALTPAPDAQTLEAFVATSPARVALLLGAEGPGLTQDLLHTADVRIRIPMSPGVDSLNVATAAAIAFHGLTRRP